MSIETHAAWNNPSLNVNSGSACSVPRHSMLSSLHERSERRQRSGRAAARRNLATTVAEAPPIAHPDRRSGPTRDGEASAWSPAQATQASLATAAWSTRRGPFVRAYRDRLAFRGFWIDGLTFCGHSRLLSQRAALTVPAPDTTILAIGSDRLPAARQPWQEQQPARQGGLSHVNAHILWLTAIASQRLGDSRQTRQRRKARMRCLAVRGLVRLSVQEPLALRPGEQCGCPFPVCHIARVGAEIELGEVAVQVRLADVVERPENAAL